MTLTQNTALGLRSWFRKSAGRGVPAAIARARISAAVILLNQLKWARDLDLEGHAMLDGRFYSLREESLRRSLQPFGWRIGVLKAQEPFVGCVEPALEELLTVLHARALDIEPAALRFALIEEMQKFLLDQARSRFCRRGIRVSFNSDFTTTAVLTEALGRAACQGKADVVAVHLVGAALELRFDSFRDIAAGSNGIAGDFQVGEAIFQVTYLPKHGHFIRGKETLVAGLRPFILVPRDRLAGARDQAEDAAPGRIAVASIEEFVAQNIEEQAEFTTVGLGGKLRALLDLYNDRVDRIESDKSLLIEIPKRLA